MMRELVPKIGPRARLVKHLGSYRTQLDNVPDEDIKPNPQMKTSVVTTESYIVDTNGMLIPNSNDTLLPNLFGKCEGNASHACVLNFEMNGESSEKCYSNTDAAPNAEVFDVSSDKIATSVSPIAVNEYSELPITAPVECHAKLSEQCQANIMQADVTTSHTYHPDSVVTQINRKPNKDPACNNSIDYEIVSTNYENSAKMARLEKGAVFKDNKVTSRFNSCLLGLKLL